MTFPSESSLGPSKVVASPQNCPNLALADLLLYRGPSVSRADWPTANARSRARCGCPCQSVLRTDPPSATNTDPPRLGEISSRLRLEALQRRSTIAVGGSSVDADFARMWVNSARRPTVRVHRGNEGRPGTAGRRPIGRRRLRSGRRPGCFTPLSPIGGARTSQPSGWPESGCPGTLGRMFPWGGRKQRHNPTRTPNHTRNGSTRPCSQRPGITKR